MALRFNFKDLNTNIESTNGIISNVVGINFANVVDAIYSESSYLFAINAYRIQISNYNQNKSVLNDAIGMIDHVLSELNSINEYIDNVKINKEKYDKDEIEGMVSSLNTVRSNLETFVTNCNNEIEKLESELSSIKNSGGN